MKIRTKKPKLTEKALTVLHYEKLLSDLIYVFNGYKDNIFDIKDSNLKRDIKVCSDAIKKIEAKMPRRHFSNLQRSFLQKEISRLNSILQRMPLRVGVDFEEYGKFVLKDEGNSWADVVKAKNKVKNLYKENTLPRLRFFPFKADTGPRSQDRVDDYSIRLRLTLGLFDYLERLITKQSLRPKCCVSCKRWFYARKSNAKTCSQPCRERKFTSTPRGRIKRMENTRRHRKKLKENTQKQSNS